MLFLFKFGWEGERMKKNIHPEFFETSIKCACGNVIETKSTKKETRIDICSKCHGFFTGKTKLVDSAGRVEKFRRKYRKNTEKNL